MPADSGFAEFLATQRKQASANRATELNTARYGLPGMLLGIALMQSLMPMHFPQARWPLVAGWVLFAIATSIERLRSEPQLAAMLPKLRVEIRSNLLDRGLLLMALDPTQSDRLPHLFDIGLATKLRPHALGDPNTLRGRFTALSMTYLDCCQDAGLPSPLAATLQGRRGRPRRVGTLYYAVVLEMVDALQSDPALLEAQAAAPEDSD
jgi:hypothetical protein